MSSPIPTPGASASAVIARGWAHDYLARLGQRENRQVKSTIRRGLAALAPLFLLIAAGFAPVAVAPPAQAQVVPLASHRAVYDLRLSQSRKAALQAVRGRILYDFTGNACEGYTTQVRQVTEMESGERGPSLSDLRSSMWEDDAGKTFRFASTNFVNQKQTQEVDGTATRGTDGIEVVLKKPVAKTFRLAAATAFPTDHLRRVIAAARAGQKVFQLPVYDGSEDGEKIYNTLTVIGDPLTRKASDAAGGKPELANATRWHVRVSYFDQRGAGEQTPVYAIAFELYDNGISGALTLDYTEFEIAGTLSSLEIRDTPACK